MNDVFNIIFYYIDIQYYCKLTTLNKNCYKILTDKYFWSKIFNKYNVYFVDTYFYTTTKQWIEFYNKSSKIKDWIRKHKKYLIEGWKYRIGSYNDEEYMLIKNYKLLYTTNNNINDCLYHHVQQCLKFEYLHTIFYFNGVQGVILFYCDRYVVENKLIVDVKTLCRWMFELLIKDIKIETL